MCAFWQLTKHFVIFTASEGEEAEYLPSFPDETQDLGKVTGVALSYNTRI